MPKTIVITGASSGIGAITAETLAGPETNLVLAARDNDALQSVAGLCTSRGANVLIVPTDVSRGAEVQALREQALEAFGAIDVWINNAGVAQLGSFLEISPEEFERVIDINLMGVVRGSRAALEVFMKQKHGTLINVSSILGAVPDPYESAYVTSKYAIRGFTASIRQEVRLAGLPDVHVCTVLPSTMDTPIYHSGANRSGKQPRAIPPIYPAEMVAEAIVRLIERPQPETVVGGVGKVLVTMHRLLPNFTERLLAKYINLFHFKNKQASETSGSLFHPSSNHNVSGDWPTLPKSTDRIVALTSLALLVFAVRSLLRKGGKS
ncbi:MAG TPA: SDR family oxidoreductase [Candidatus Limnocylindrales bacterium]|nr:SDR family oxidoreductase [Candidatus Limnocylindrales bacterium]